MGAWSWVRASVSCPLVSWTRLGVAACLLTCGFANGQQSPRATEPGANWTNTQTVSVATLRIPPKAWEHFVKANAAANAKRVDEFERETTKALAIEPAFAEIYVLRAHWKVLTGQYDAAVADIVQAQRIQPDMFWAGLILAQAYNGAHRFHDAMVVLNNLHGSQADTWQAKYEMARAAIGLRDIELSLRWTGLAMAAAPEDFAEVHLLRANALLVANRWNDSVRELETYLETAKEKNKREQVTKLLTWARAMATDPGAASQQNVASR